MRRLPALALAIASAASTFAGPAAATPSSRLTYVRGPGAEGCPDEAELRRAVAQRLGYDPFFPTASRTIVAKIEHKTAGYAAELAVLDAAGVSLGERKLPTASNDCTELVRSLALAISIVVDDLDMPAAPKADARPEEQAPSPDAAPPAPPSGPSPVPPPDATPGAEAPRAAPWHVAVEIAGLGAAASAPSPGLGASLGARVVGSWWAFGLEGRYDLPASDAIPAGGRVETQLALGAASACVWLGERWRPFACAVGALGSLTASATGVTAPQTTRALFAGAGARIGAEVDIAGPIYAFGRLGTLGSFTPHRIHVNGELVFTLPSVSGEVALGLGWRIL